MEILIFGAGAVGLGLANCLIKSGNTVHIIGREETVSALSIDGLERTGLFGDFHAPPFSFSAYCSVEEPESGPYDYVLVCTKSFDTRAAGETLAAAPAIRSDRTQFVLCQNGWGNAEAFSAFFPTEQIKAGRIITGFRRPKPNQVDITVHADAVHLGSLYDDNLDSLEPLAKALEEGGLPSRITENIEKDLWAKMLYNCMLNGLSTLYGVAYGYLGESVHTRDLMDTIAHEVFEVMQASGHSTHWEKVEDYLKVFYGNQLPATYRHEPSMLQDIRAHKPTEIDALNGAVVALGRKHGVPTPVNHTIQQMIHFLTERPKIV
ncbi:MAG: 2-dehydropantoate 2-reductase [Nitrospina sp.]|nr:2-dehydropantoate 2-reductase [Nitrospina sp.]